jgi:hypothetical protein
MHTYNVYDHSFVLHDEVQARTIEDAMMYVTRYMRIPGPILAPVNPEPGFLHRANIEGSDYYLHKHERNRYQPPGPHLFGATVESADRNRPMGARGEVFRPANVVLAGGRPVPFDRTRRPGRTLDS